MNFAANPLTRRQFLTQTAALGTAALLPGQAFAMSNQSVPTPLPRIAAFEQLAFGIFVHFGLYSLVGKGEWTMFSHKTPRDEYMKLMDRWEVPDFDGQKLARLAKDAGAKYITLTSRHHDGFSLYDSQGLCPWDVTKTPSKRDIVKEFVEGCRAEGIIPCLYHTTLDWSEPRYQNDWKSYQQYLRDSVELVCSNYGPLGALWFDGNWNKPDADWELDGLYSVVRKHQPDALIINNTGIDAHGQLGHPEIDAVTFERGRPEPIDRTGMPKYVAGEMCHTANHHWGVAVNDFNMISPASVVEELCRTRAAGANLLMNLGPTATGALPDYEKAMFELVGKWVTLHGGDQNPLYAGRPSGIQGEEDDFGFQIGDDLYLFVFSLTATADPRVTGAKSRGPGPRNYQNIPTTYKSARWLDNNEDLKFTQENNTLTLQATQYPYGTNTIVRIAKLQP